MPLVAILPLSLDPDFMANTMNTGYSDFSNKIIPDIIVDGGITEFDRGLETKGDSTDIGIDGTFKGGKLFGFESEDASQGSLARVTLDFNLIDFETFSGIPQMQAINSIKLHKAVRSDSIGFTIISASFGAKGSVKKVQGRHAAVRLLVQLSMLQVVGKYQQVPYWRLLAGSVRDVNLLNRVIDDYYSLPSNLRTARMQVFLALNGYPVDINGVQDQKTQDAKQKIISKYNLESDSNDAKIFITAYENVPITRENKYKSQQFHNQFQQVAQSGSIEPEQIVQQLRPKPVPIAQQKAVFNGNISLKTSKRTYNLGEKMTVSFTVDKPMYVRVAVIGSDGSVATLFPNPFQNDNFCKPGTTYQIPPPNNTDFSLDIGEPKGVDKIRAIGSAVPVVSGQVSYSSSGDLDTSKIKAKVITAGTEVTIQ